MALLIEFVYSGQVKRKGEEHGREGPRKEKTMKVLVTGATGKVGGELVKVLLQGGAGVRAFTQARGCAAIHVSSGVRVHLRTFRSDPAIRFHWRQQSSRRRRFLSSPSA
jgi:hypothetical protein